MPTLGCLGGCKGLLHLTCVQRSFKLKANAANDHFLDAYHHSWQLLLMEATGLDMAHVRPESWNLFFYPWLNTTCRNLPLPSRWDLNAPGEVGKNPG